jgi:hydroxyacylglutathione hydrolase
MYIEQLYTKCLSEAAYYIESNGEAAIIDPIRDIDAYLDLAKTRGTVIKYIFETHFHADFVSGHLDLSHKTSAPIIYGPQAITSFKTYLAKDEETFQLGNITITALHTPGHTLESTCYLLKDEARKDHCIFTGDTLFVGDVGRPDLFGSTLSKEDLATMLFHSLDQKIKPLADDVIVYPAHGAGSSCGKSLGPESFSTIGVQKATNYALLATDLDAFVKEVTTGLNTPPAYFPLNAKINKEGYDSLDLVIEQSLKPLSALELQEAMQGDITVLDTRSADLFTQGFIPTSVFVGLDGRFAEWAASILPIKKAIILVCDTDTEKEAVIRLSRVGYDNVIGYLQGGFHAWQSAGLLIDMIVDIDADELAMDLKFDEKLIILDVRKEGEFNNGHVEDAVNSPLSNLIDPGAMSNIEEEDNVYVHCAGGYRSVIACSILKKEGYHNIRNILGGWTAIKEVKDMPLVKPNPILN